MKRTVGILFSLAIALFGATAGASQAQVQARVQAQESGARGWLGLSVNLVASPRGASTPAIVTGVIEGGPAQRAGIRPGDRLVQFNGRDWAERYTGFSPAVSPGDVVRLVVERDGRLQEVQLTAAERPRLTAVEPTTVTLTLRADSMADWMFRAMDSLRVQLVMADEAGVLVRRESVLRAADSAAAALSGGRALVRLRGEELPRVLEAPSFRATLRGIPELYEVPEPEVRPPFGFFAFHGEENDSLRTALDAVNQELRTLRSRRAARILELAATDGGNLRTIDRNDDELRRLEEQMAEVNDRALSLRAAMERVARDQAADQLSETAVWRSAGDADAPEPRQATWSFRPLTPYVLGQNRAAGAEVIDLKPEMAGYFGVEKGVLVIEVTRGTPAARAGIQPGDVITRIGETPVSSIQELRLGLAEAGSDPSVTLIRKGDRVQLSLHR